MVAYYSLWVTREGLRGVLSVSVSLTLPYRCVSCRDGSLHDTLLALVPVLVSVLGLALVLVRDLHQRFAQRTIVRIHLHPSHKK